MMPNREDFQTDKAWVIAVLREHQSSHQYWVDNLRKNPNRLNEDAGLRISIVSIEHQLNDVNRYEELISIIEEKKI